MIFDRGVSKELPKEELAQSVTPIKAQFDHLLKKTVMSSPNEIGLAITILENHAGSLMTSAQWCREKADQEMDYARQLRASLREELHRRGVNHLEVGGFLFTVSEDGLSIEMR
jgi:hypothetical protein